MKEDTNLRFGMRLFVGCRRRTAVRSRNGFSLMELLAVVAVVAALSALLIPVMTKTRERGLDAKCLANLRQVASAFTLYVADNNGSFFPDNEAKFTFLGYLGFTYPKSRPNYYYSDAFQADQHNVYRCPKVQSIRPRNLESPVYTPNYVLINTIGGVTPVGWPLRMSNVPSVSKMWTYTEGARLDAQGGYKMDPTYYAGNASFTRYQTPGYLTWPHGGKQAFSFLDGHAELLSFSQVAELNKPGTKEYSEFHGVKQP
jgi:prepilin-type N-terminal cleavage/methylation domain-containing protein